MLAERKTQRILLRATKTQRNNVLKLSQQTGQTITDVIFAAVDSMLQSQSTSTSAQPTASASK